MRSRRTGFRLLLENEIHRQHQEDKSDQMIDLQGFVFEKRPGEHHEDHQRDRLLDHLELNE
jgi:hypothetical protein